MRAAGLVALLMGAWGMGVDSFYFIGSGCHLSHLGSSRVISELFLFGGFKRFVGEFRHYPEPDDDMYAEDEGDQQIPILTDDICLVPGDPIVRVEVAPSNARRIFTGIDINCNIDQVWGILTDYDNLHEVIPSLVKNEVVYKTARGARLSQVRGGCANGPGQRESGAGCPRRPHRAPRRVGGCGCGRPGAEALLQPAGVVFWWYKNLKGTHPHPHQRSSETLPLARG